MSSAGAGTTPWTCRCGEVRLEIGMVPRGGSHVVCYCTDCRAFARLTGAEATLDPSGGVALYQTSPERIVIASGAQNLRCLRLTKRGPLRWTTSCCNTAVANTAPMRGVPFASLIAAGFPPTALGRMAARVNRGSATGKVPRPYGSLAAMVAALAGRMARSRLSGDWRRTPFFGEDGEPLALPVRPDPATLKHAYSSAP